MVRASNSAILSDDELDLREQQAYVTVLERSAETLTEGYVDSDWVTWALEEVVRLGELPEQWDGEGSIAPSAAVVQISEAVIAELIKLNSNLSSPYIVPAVDGRILFEWRDMARTLDIEVSPTQKVIFLFRDRDSNKISKGTLTQRYVPTNFVQALNLF